MFILVEHPFCDLRYFLTTSSNRLDKPVWPSPDFNQYVRSSGIVRTRFLGSPDWAGERRFAVAKNAFKFPNLLHKQNLAGNSISAYTGYTQRRYFSDRLMARFEVWFNITASREIKKPEDNIPDYIPQTSSEFEKVLKAYLNIPVSVSIGNNIIKQSRVATCGSALAKHYLLATTNRKKQPVINTWWMFTAGDPAIFVELGNNDKVLPRHSNLIFPLPNNLGALYHCWLNVDGQTCGVWILKWDKKNGDKKNNLIRHLRIYLTRLHVERVCLQKVYEAICSGTLDIKSNAGLSDLIQDYLNQKTKILTKPERCGFDQASILKTARNANLEIYGSNNLEDMRRQIKLKVESYIQHNHTGANIIIDGNQDIIKLGNIEVHGNFTQIVAKNITNSFNQVTESKTSPLPNEKLETLIQELAKLCATILKKPEEQEQVEQITHDLKKFIDEVILKKPNKEADNSIFNALNKFNQKVEPFLTAHSNVKELSPYIISIFTLLSQFLN